MSVDGCFSRKRLGREPTAKELEDLSEEGQRKESITPEDIMAAFSKGEEVYIYISNDFHGLNSTYFSSGAWYLANGVRRLRR